MGPTDGSREGGSGCIYPDDLRRRDPTNRPSPYQEKVGYVQGITLPPPRSRAPPRIMLTKRTKLLLALLAALVTAVSAAGDKVLPLLEQVIAAFGEEPNPEAESMRVGGFAGSLADDGEDAGADAG